MRADARSGLSIVRSIVQIYRSDVNCMKYDSPSGRPCSGFRVRPSTGSVRERQLPGENRSPRPHPPASDGGSLPSSVRGTPPRRSSWNSNDAFLATPERTGDPFRSSTLDLPSSRWGHPSTMGDTSPIGQRQVGVAHLGVRTPALQLGEPGGLATLSPPSPVSTSLVSGFTVPRCTALTIRMFTSESFHRESVHPRPSPASGGRARSARPVRCRASFAGTKNPTATLREQDDRCRRLHADLFVTGMGSLVHGPPQSQGPAQTAPDSATHRHGALPTHGCETFRRPTGCST